MDCCERSVTAGGAPSTSTASQTTATWLAPGMHPRHAADRGPTTFMRCKVRTTGILLCPISRRGRDGFCEGQSYTGGGGERNTLPLRIVCWLFTSFKTVFQKCLALHNRIFEFNFMGTR